MAKQEKPAEDRTTDQTQEAAQGGESQGVRARRAIMLKEFIPHADFINKEVVGKGKGTKVILGRIFGFITSTADKVGRLPNGEESISIVFNGQFESENYLTGEISQSSSVYFPSSFSEAVKAMFIADPDLKVVEIDTDVGVEATGKTIPYTWVVVNHVEGEAMTPLKRLRKVRGRPSGAPALAAPVAQKALEAPKG